MEHKVGFNETNNLPLYMYILVNDDLKIGFYPSRNLKEKFTNFKLL